MANCELNLQTVANDDGILRFSLQASQLKGSPVILVVPVILVLPVISSLQGGSTGRARFVRQ